MLNVYMRVREKWGGGDGVRMPDNLIILYCKQFSNGLVSTDTMNGIIKLH